MSLHLDNVTLDVQTLSGQKRVLFSNLSAEIKPGEFCALLGVNGSGKTSLLKMAAGIKPIKAGSIHVDNHDIRKLNSLQRANYFGYLPQTSPLHYNLIVADLVRLGTYPLQKQHLINKQEQESLIDEKLSELKITHLRDRNIFSLSGGEFQKAMLARVLAGNASYLLFDEPGAALDIHHELELMEILTSLKANNKKGLLIAMHDIELAARYADKVLLLAPDTPETYLFGNTNDIISDKNIPKVFKVRMVKTNNTTSFFPV